MMQFDCDIYLDMMPLVKDGAASDATRQALEEHLKTCESCRELYNTIPDAPPPPDETRSKRILRKIRERKNAILISFMVVGVLLAFLVTMTESMALTVAIFPLVGIAAFIVLRMQSLFMLLATFAVNWVLLSVRTGDMAGAVSWAFHYTYACLVGVLIGGVLWFVFEKPEVKSRILRFASVLLVMIPVFYGMIVMDINIGGNPMFRQGVEIQAREYLDQAYPGNDYVITQTTSNIPLLYNYSVYVTSESDETVQIILDFDGIGLEPVERPAAD